MDREFNVLNQLYAPATLSYWVHIFKYNY